MSSFSLDKKNVPAHLKLVTLETSKGHDGEKKPYYLERTKSDMQQINNKCWICNVPFF